MKFISIVVPAFNEEFCIQELVTSIKAIFDDLSYRWEIIIVDDGSEDRTFERVESLNKSDGRIKGIRLSRNMGQQAALDCGLNNASGDAVISMDADLQHPPQLIRQMLNEMENGADIVTTSKKDNKSTSWSYRIMARLFYGIFNRFSQIKLTPNGSDFRLLSRRSLNALLSMPEYHKFYRGMVHFVGFKSKTIEFKVDKRFAGERKYNFRKSMKLATDGLFSFSDFALKLPIAMGAFTLLLIVLYLVYELVGLVFFDFTFEKGWTSIVSLIIISTSIQLIFMGTLGIYIGKIFFEVKKRPVYFTEEKVGKFMK